MIPNRKCLAVRPLGAVNKTRHGHYEGDTIVAPKHAGTTAAVAIVAERKTRFLVAAKIPSLAPHDMTHAVNGFEKEVAMKSLTMDNGIENKAHEQWGVPAYFADPHSPWQKPLIENSIGLLRRWFFKKGTDWSLVSEESLRASVDFLNGKYRKSLNYQSAFEVAAAHGMIAYRETKTPPEGGCN